MLSPHRSIARSQSRGRGPSREVQDRYTPRVFWRGRGSSPYRGRRSAPHRSRIGPQTAYVPMGPQSPHAPCGLGRGRRFESPGLVLPGDPRLALPTPRPGIGRGEFLKFSIERLLADRDRRFFAATIRHIKQSRIGLRTSPEGSPRLDDVELYITITKGVPGHIVRLARP